jgi:hypothetical protein
MLVADFRDIPDFRDMVIWRHGDAAGRYEGASVPYCHLDAAF